MRNAIRIIFCACVSEAHPSGIQIAQPHISPAQGFLSAESSTARVSSQRGVVPLASVSGGSIVPRQAQARNIVGRASASAVTWTDNLESALGPDRENPWNQQFPQFHREVGEPVSPYDLAHASEDVYSLTPGDVVGVQRSDGSWRYAKLLTWKYARLLDRKKSKFPTLMTFEVDKEQSTKEFPIGSWYLIKTFNVMPRQPSAAGADGEIPWMKKWLRTAFTGSQNKRIRDLFDARPHQLPESAEAFVAQAVATASAQHFFDVSSGATMYAEAASSVSSSYVVLVGLFVGMGITFSLLRTRGASTAGKQPLIAL